MNRTMRRRLLALTRSEVVVVVVCIVFVLVILAGFILPMLGRPRIEARREVCAHNLGAIGQAIAAYRENNSDYFPFSWGPADIPEPRRKDALASLGCFYPDYLIYPNVFRCPSAENAPHFEIHASESQMNTEPKQEKANWVLVDSSYGYDCRVLPRISADSPVVADMDGSYKAGDDSATQNHTGVQNVLFADGSVKWLDMEAVWMFGPGQEDIYTEDPWHADTDAFISNNTWRGQQRTPSGPDDLGPSYDPYPSLHPNAEE